MPEGGQDSVAPVDDLNVAFVVDGFDDLAGDLFGFEHHGITEVTAEQVGIDETGADVGETDFQSTGFGLLLQGLKIDVLKCLSSGIGRSRTEPLCACNRGDGGNMALALFGTVAVGLPYHAGEAQAIGVHRIEFDVGCERAVLLTDARGIEEQVHATQTVY